MKSIYVIITALTATALAQGSIKCNFSEVPGTQQCHGAAGQVLMFNLPNIKDSHTRIKKDKSDRIFEFNKNKSKFHEEYTNNPELYANGSLKLGEATKNHSGDYMLEVHGLNGTLILKQHVHLEIQAPVSKPAVSQTCLSPENMTISCSSEGEKVEFGLTLDGKLLFQKSDNSTPLNSTTEKTLAGTTEEDKPNVSSVTISLNGQLTGNFVCNVQNHVSREQTVMRLKSCPAPVSKPAVSQMCLSPEKMTVSCSSEGEKVEFLLTLDGKLLIQTSNNSAPLNIRTEKTLAETTDEDKPSVSSVTISLNGHLTGNLMCNVQNHVSREQTVMHLKSCPVSSPFPVLAVTTVAAFLVVLLLALSCGLIILRNNVTPVAGTMDNHEGEVIYSDVKIVQSTGTTEPNPNQNSTDSFGNCTVQNAEVHESTI